MFAFFRRKKMKIPKSPSPIGFFRRCFEPKDLLIKKHGKVTFFALTEAKQWTAFIVVSLAFLWTIFTSIYFFQSYDILLNTRSDLKQSQEENFYLQREWLAFDGYMAEVLEKIDENKQEVQSLASTHLQHDTSLQKISDFKMPKKTDFEIKSEKLVSKNNQLKQKTKYVQNRMPFFEKVKLLKPMDKKDITINQALLQRDIAVDESKSLQKKVNELETLVSKMQETQMLVFHKMANLSDKNILSIEDDFSEIKTALSKTGLSMNYLLRRIHNNNENIGIGGPYIPAPMPKPENQLNISLVSLNKRMNRWYDLKALQDVLPLGKPVKRIRVTSPFGDRSDPFAGGPATHEGLDIGGMIGEPIWTRAAGKVVRAGQWGWYGNIVEIDHGLGFRTRYAHMDKIFVSKGDSVHSGDQIGTLGNTGRSTGPHIHYEIRVNGHPTNPMNFIKASKNVFKN